ncbi:NUDIX domain-containing protein [Flagellimonas flava]|uniref:NUDIX domain-containing protein n=1 Tax=Flagellimonas flava TaxID=570519 RepID=UPI003D656921
MKKSKVVKSRLLAIHQSKVMVLQKVGKKRKYTLPGGIKKNSETEIQALIRETKEEIELDIVDLNCTFFLSLVKSSTEEFINRNYYYIHMEPMAINVKEKEKFKKVLWLNWKKALEHMDRSDQLAVKTYFKNVADNFQNHVKYGHKISSRIAM